jgi:hypothetical protein
MAAREAYSLYVERAVAGANEADGPLSSLQLGHSSLSRMLSMSAIPPPAATRKKMMARPG